MAPHVSEPRPILCAVLDGDALQPAPRARAAALFAAGVDWIQLRDRRRGGADLLSLARYLVAARDEASVRGRLPRVIVNKRVDVAIAAGADGVHLGLDALDPASADALLRGQGVAGAPARAPWIGASCHAVAELEAAIASGAPLVYAHLAPIWAPRSKPAERPALGLEPLARAARAAAQAGMLLIAQGGLDPDRAGEAIAAGATGVAVTGILQGSGDPAQAARRLRAALDGQATGNAAAVAR